MGRPVPGVQLGRSARPAILRAAALAAVGFGALAVWGGVSLFQVRAALREAARSAVPAAPPEAAGAPARLETEAARGAAVLLLSGALDAPDYSGVFETIAEAAPAGIRIAGIEARPGDPGRVLAEVSAEGDSETAVADFLSALGGREAVLSTEVISEIRRPNGGTTIRVTAELDASRRSS